MAKIVQHIADTTKVAITQPLEWRKLKSLTKSPMPRRKAAEASAATPVVTR